MTFSSLTPRCNSLKSSSTMVKSNHLAGGRLLPLLREHLEDLAFLRRLTARYQLQVYNPQPAHSTIQTICTFSGRLFLVNHLLHVLQVSCLNTCKAGHLYKVTWKAIKAATVHDSIYNAYVSFHTVRFHRTIRLFIVCSVLFDSLVCPIRLPAHDHVAHKTISCVGRLGTDMKQNNSRYYDTKGHSAQRVNQRHSFQSGTNKSSYYSMMNRFNSFGQSQTIPGGGYTIPDKRSDTTY